MKYRIRISPLAENDIIQQVYYIAYDKGSPGAALAIERGLRGAIADLGNMPTRYPLDDDPRIAAIGIRKCLYRQRYRIFFLIDYRNGTIHVLRVLHILMNAGPLLLDSE